MTSHPQRFAIALATILAFGGTASAQLPASPKAPAVTRTVNLTLEQRHTIRELAKDLKVAPAAGVEKVKIGQSVPSQIELRPIPPLMGQKVPQIKAHRFYVTSEQIVIVDPQEAKVVEAIDVAE